MPPMGVTVAGPEISSGPFSPAIPNLPAPSVPPLAKKPPNRSLRPLKKPPPPPPHGAAAEPKPAAPGYRPVPS